MRLRAGLALAPLLLAAHACSSSGTASSIDEADFPTEVASRLCAQQLSCDCYPLAGPVGEDPAAYTRSQCLENRRLELEHWQALMTDLGFHYDGACLAHKLSEAQWWGCGDAADVADLVHAQRCASRCRVYHGDVAAGEPCSLEPFDDCTQGFHCRPQPDETTTDPYDTVMRCVPVCGSDGSSCRTADACAPGLFCRPDGEPSDPGTDATCRPAPGEGEDCSTYYTCAGSLACSYQPDSDSYRCTALVEDGQPCDPNVGCRGTCNAGTCTPGTPQICSWDARSG